MSGVFDDLYLYPLFMGSTMLASYLGLTVYDYFFYQEEPYDEEAPPSDDFYFPPGQLTKLNHQPAKRLEMSFQVMSMTHAIGVSALAGYSLLTEPHWNLVNTPFQNFIIKFSLGYFIADLFNILMRDWSMEYFLHHTVSGAYWLSVIFTNVCGYYGVAGAFLGEITNPFQITWSFSRKNGFRKLFNLFSPIYTWFYLVVRCLCIPAFTIMSAQHLWYQTHAPLYWKYFWISSSVLMNLGSWYWAYLITRGYLKFKKRQKAIKNE